MKRFRFRQCSTRRGDTERGQAMVELLFVSITFLFVILGVIQLAMCLNAYALVRYAAYNSARAAIVHGADQDKMEEAARLSLLAIFPTHGRADHPRGMTENYLGAKIPSPSSLFTKSVDQDSILTFLTTKYFFRPITEVKIIDNNSAEGSVVTFDDAADSEKGVITVQVSHLYELVIPLVNRIIFYLHKRISGFDPLDFVESGLDNPIQYLLEDVSDLTLDHLALRTHRKRLSGGTLSGVNYRIPIVAHYTMRLQSDWDATE